jgi:hypothetical protein
MKSPTDPDFKQPITQEANESSLKALRPTLMLAGVCIVGIAIAALIVWSPWA